MHLLRRLHTSPFRSIKCPYFRGYFLRPGTSRQPHAHICDLLEHALGLVESSLHTL